MKPYHKNPRQIKQKRFDALTDTLDRLGDLGGIVHNQRTDEVIGGNQRTRVFSEASEVQLIEMYDKPDRQGTIAHGFIVWRGTKFSYRLVDWDEATCEEANIKANLGAGDWDWGKIADEWTDVAGFKDWFDADLLRDWGRDYSALRIFLDVEAVNYDEEWEGMPEFEQADISAKRRIVVNFMTDDDVMEFSKVIGQKITEKTKFIYFPKIEDTPYQHMETDGE